MWLLLLALGCTHKASDDTAAEPQRAPERAPEPDPWQAPGTQDDEAFAWGLATGDATPSSIVLTLHSTEPTVSLALMRAEGESWVEDQTLSDLALTDGFLWQKIEGLQPDAAYAIAAYAADGDRRSPVGRFRTALDADGWRVLTFGGTSGLGSPDSPWPNLTQISHEQLDLFMQLGDTIYADPDDTLEEYRASWSTAWQTQGLHDINLSTSMVATWDDHEVANNWSWDELGEGQYDAAYQAFREYIPFEDGPGAGSGVWRTLHWGRVADILVMDCRSERTDTQYISPEQMQWLKDELTASTARFKFIVNSVPITDLSPMYGDILAEDRWQGYPEQRSEILQFIEDEDIQGLLWITGDVHFPAITHVDGRDGIAWDQWEVFTGPSGSTLNVTAGMFLGDEQYPVLFTAWNATWFEADPGTGQVHVRFIGDEGETLEEMTLQL